MARCDLPEPKHALAWAINDVRAQRGGEELGSWSMAVKVLDQLAEWGWTMVRDPARVV